MLGPLVVRPALPEAIMSTLPGLPFEGEALPDGGLRIKGDDLDATLRARAEARGWVKESGGPRWLHPDGGILPLL